LEAAASKTAQTLKQTKSYDTNIPRPTTFITDIFTGVHTVVNQGDPK